jgi:hypothetical protein
VPDNVVPSSFKSMLIGCAMPWPSAAESSPVHFPATPVWANAEEAAIKQKTKSDSESFTFILLLSLQEQCRWANSVYCELS